MTTGHTKGDEMTGELIKLCDTCAAKAETADGAQVELCEKCSQAAEELVNWVAENN